MPCALLQFPPKLDMPPCCWGEKTAIAMCWAASAQVWQDALLEKQQAPYMRQTLASGGVRSLRFCPYEVRPGPASRGCRAKELLHQGSG